MSFIKKVIWDINKEYRNLQKKIHELKSIGVEITNVCNLNCKHCYMNSSRTQNDSISTTAWKNFFSELRSEFGNKIVIQITGGEPLIRNDIWEILYYLKNLGFKVTLVTNGTLLNEEKIINLNKCLSSLSISLDGLEDGHNYLRGGATYGVVLKNIKLANKLKTKYLIVKSAIYKKNFEELNDLYRMISELGVTEWHLFAMEPIGRGQLNKKEILSVEEYDKLRRFVNQIKNNKNNKLAIRFEEEGNKQICSRTCDYCEHKFCGAGISSCAILYNGDIINCVQNDRSHAETHGNIKRDNFKNIWETKFIKNRQQNYKFCDNHYFLNNRTKI